jgi:hypothetical protein
MIEMNHTLSHVVSGNGLTVGVVGNEVNSGFFTLWPDVRLCAKFCFFSNIVRPLIFSRRGLARQAATKEFEQKQTEQTKRKENSVENLNPLRLCILASLL